MVLSSQNLLQTVLSSGGLPEATAHLSKIAEDLGFNLFAYGVKLPFPICSPRIEMISNYSEAWQAQYKRQKYADIDPTVRHCSRTTTPFAWTSNRFQEAEFAEQAMSHGIAHGISVCVRDAQGHLGMMTLARDQRACSETEFAHLEGSVALLGQLTHAALVEKVVRRGTQGAPTPLSEREREVLKWTAEGKTSAEVAMIMNITERTVNFHISNCIVKLEASNKLHAAVKAAVSGLLG